MPRFTKQQKRAIFEDGCDLLVSAAAGSGKTAVLSERVLEKLIGGHDITEFLIVTFTNAAAAEMRERITKKLSEKIESASKYDYLSRQITLIGKASITTIHSFCLDIIKNNFHLLNIDPAFKIADENEVALLKLESADETLERMYADDPDMTDRLCTVFGGKDEALEDEIINLHKFMGSFPDPAKWLNEQCEKYESFTTCDDIFWTESVKEEAALKLLSLKEEFYLLYDYASKLGMNYSAALLKDTGDMLSLYESCTLPWQEFYEAVSSYKFGSIGRRSKDEDTELADEVSAKRKKLKDEFDKIQDLVCGISPEKIVEDTKSAYPVIKTLEKCVNTFSEIFAEKKRLAGVIDFSDFEHLALSLLKDSSNGIAEKLRNKYTEIFVDEYQDCNMTQETLFSYISRKEDGKCTNMFMVGDLKQSIYKFRQADPTIFLYKAKTYTDDGKQRKIMLNKNFRSTSVILRCINRIFEACMTEKTGGIDYTDDEKLYYRSDTVPEGEPKCELLLIEDKSGDELLESAPESKIGYEARLIAKKILELHKNGCRFSDIAVLMRNIKTNVSAFEAEFKALDIPYYVDGGGGFFDSFEIRLFMSILKICDNPYQDIPLIGVMLSPIFGFSQDDLLKIRMNHRGSFYKAIVKYADNDGTHEKCTRFLNTLAKWRDMSVSLPIDEFLRYICEETYFDDFVLSLPGGTVRRSNLDLLFEQAERLCNMGVSDLFGFILHLDRLTAGGESAGAKTISESADVVRIMSIHKSKGLQFENVFVAGCSKRFNMKDTEGKLLYHKELGIGLNMTDGEKRLKYKLLSHKAVAAAVKRENTAEEMRILYVALTRAQTRLFCTATVPDAENITERKGRFSSPFNASSYIDWISAGLCDDWNVEIYEKNELDAELADTETQASEASVQVSDFVRDTLSYTYPYESVTSLPVKLSVSEIKKAQSYDDPSAFKLFSPELKTLPDFIGNTKLSGANIGTVNHLVLKELDINSPDVSACVSQMKEKGLITEEEASYILNDKIEAFTKSNVFSRMRKSKKVLRELSFNLPVPSEEIFPSAKGETVLVQGIMDCIFEENGALVILDYKTDMHLSPERLNEYRRQLDIYAKAAEIIMKAPVKEKILYLIRDEKEIIV